MLRRLFLFLRQMIKTSRLPHNLPVSRRSTTLRSGQEAGSMAEELEIVRHYLVLQKTAHRRRFGGPRESRSALPRYRDFAAASACPR